MKKKFSEIEPGSRLILHLTNGEKTIELNACLARHLKENIAVITLPISKGQILKFDNMSICVIYTNPKGIPYSWSHAAIVYYHGRYLLKVNTSSGSFHNRRSSFRVRVFEQATLYITGKWDMEVTVRDISLTGFSILDKEKELPLEHGSHAILKYEDIGHVLNLEGKVVRIEETEEQIIYGFVITKSCKDLSSYVNKKQGYDIK